MPLAKRIIPCLDVNQGRVLKGEQFIALRDAGDPVALARKYRDDGADELVFLDITASVEKRATLSNMVSRVARQLDIPFTVGGGIKTIEEARAVLYSGADKVSVNTAAVERPDLITKLADLFGTQCVVVAIDAKRHVTQVEPHTEFWFEVHTYGGRAPTGRDALEWAAEAARRGAGELLVTSIDQDGRKQGYDTILLEALANTVTIPIIASGGCGNPQHMYEAFVQGKADAALAASIFHFDEYPIPVVKQYLRERGIDMR
jgi:imidazole glycerol-phosphate synthase subunit HisF